MKMRHRLFDRHFPAPANKHNIQKNNGYNSIIYYCNFSLFALTNRYKYSIILNLKYTDIYIYICTNGILSKHRPLYSSENNTKFAKLPRNKSAKCKTTRSFCGCRRDNL